MNTPITAPRPRAGATCPTKASADATGMNGTRSMRSKKLMTVTVHSVAVIRMTTKMPPLRSMASAGGMPCPLPAWTIHKKRNALMM